jgi:hypothetical protein
MLSRPRAAGGRRPARGAYQARKSPDGPAIIQEIVMVRNKGRAYFLTGVFPAADAKAREQVRKSVGTLSW